METPESIFVNQTNPIVDLTTMPVHQSISDATGTSIDSWMAEMLRESVQSNSIPDATGISTFDFGMEDV